MSIQDLGRKEYVGGYLPVLTLIVGKLDKRGQSVSQNINQFVVHEHKIVGNIENGDGFGRGQFREMLPDSVGVFAFHHKNPVGPAEHPFGEFDPRPLLGSGRAHVVVLTVGEELLGSQAAPFVLATHKEEFFSHDTPSSHQNSHANLLTKPLKLALQFIPHLF